MKHKFISDNKALAAIEFAVILPILLAMILGTIEYSRAYYYQMKANKISGAMADSISMSLPYYRTDGTKLANDCITTNTINDNAWVLTENRLNEIVSSANYSAMLAPLDPSRIYIRVSSIYQGYGNGACSSAINGNASDYHYSTNSGIICHPITTWQLGFGNASAPATDSAIGAQGNAAILPTSFSTYKLLPGQNIIAVETYIKFDSIISGGLSYIVLGLASGYIKDTSYYLARNSDTVLEGSTVVPVGGLSKLKSGGC